MTTRLNEFHINTYIALGGDIDAWTRSCQDHALDMTDQHWALIEELRQGLCLSAKGLASGEFVARTEWRLTAVTENEAVRSMLRAVVADAITNGTSCGDRLALSPD